MAPQTATHYCPPRADTPPPSERAGVRLSARTRAETDYLFDLCLRLDLRFIVIADRYEWPNVSRSVEDLKSRYYGIAQRLVEARADFPEQAAAHPVCADPFNAAHERERKDDLAALLSRSAAREREETELLAKAAEIEAARKVEIEAARAAGKAFGFGSRSSGRFPDLRPDHAPLVDIEQEVGGPILATAVYGQDRPPPGVYPRGLHTISVANEVAARRTRPLPLPFPSSSHPAPHARNHLTPPGHLAPPAPAPARRSRPAAPAPARATRRAPTRGTARWTSPWRSSG